MVILAFILGIAVGVLGMVIAALIFQLKEYTRFYDEYEKD